MTTNKKSAGPKQSRTPTLDGYEVRKTDMPHWGFVRRFIYPKEKIIYINIGAEPDANIDWVEW